MLVPHLDPKTERIAQLPLFATCSLRELGRIATVGTELDLAARREIPSRRAPRCELIVLLEGSVELVECGRVVSWLDAGGVVGPLTPQVPPAAVMRVGTSGASVLAFASSEVASLTHDIPTFAARLAAAPRFEVSTRLDNC